MGGRRPGRSLDSEPAIGDVNRVSLALVGVLLLAGCSGQVTTLDFPPPGSTLPTTTTTKPKDLTAVTLARVPSQPSAKVTVGPGSATISGTVVGPGGPVGGAVIQAERLVGDAVGSAQVTAQADGTWSMPHILGGRYRVRAWRPPDLALTTPEIFFLNGTDTKSLTLQLLQWIAADATGVIAPNPPTADEPATLVVLVTTQMVDANGIVRAQPAAGASVQLSAGGPWVTADPNPAVTGTDGTASWQVVCTQAGPQPLAVVVNATNTFALSLPACGPPPTTTAPTTTVPPSTTSTTITQGTTSTM
jgi:hypothetical protein